LVSAVLLASIGGGGAVVGQPGPAPSTAASPSGAQQAHAGSDEKNCPPRIKISSPALERARVLADSLPKVIAQIDGAPPPAPTAATSQPAAPPVGPAPQVEPRPPETASEKMLSGALHAQVDAIAEREAAAETSFDEAQSEHDPARHAEKIRDAVRALDERDGLLRHYFDEVKGMIQAHEELSMRHVVSLGGPAWDQAKETHLLRNTNLEGATYEGREVSRALTGLGQLLQQTPYTATYSVQPASFSPNPLSRADAPARKGVVDEVPAPNAPEPVQGREPGGIKFSSARAAALAKTLDISSVAFDAARGRIVLSGGKTSQTFALDVFADVLRLAAEQNAPFFSLDPSNAAEWDGSIGRVQAAFDKKYGTAADLIEAVKRASPPPVTLGERSYYYTTAEALDPELVFRANQGHDVTTKLVFSPAWLRYSKVGKILYEGDLAIKAVATGFVEHDGLIEPVQDVWNLPGFAPIWAKAADESTGRANFELPHLDKDLSLVGGRIDLSQIHPLLYFTKRLPGTNTDDPSGASQRDKDMSTYFSQHWPEFEKAVPEIARLDMVFRAYVGAYFLLRDQPAMAARILKFAHERPPQQPPLLEIRPIIIRVAVQDGGYATIGERKELIEFGAGYGGGVDMDPTKTDPQGRLRLRVRTPPARPWWQNLFATAWYDGHNDAVESQDAEQVAIDFAGGDAPAWWHGALLALAAALALGASGAALVRRRLDWQQLAVANTCEHCARTHRQLGAVSLAADVVTVVSLAYLGSLPLLAAAADPDDLDWSKFALAAATAPLAVGVLGLLGLALREAAGIFVTPKVQNVGFIPCIFLGARATGLVVPAFLFHAGLTAGSVGSSMALVMTTDVAERMLAMCGGAAPVMAAALFAFIGALVAIGSRWFAPYAMGSRPLPLQSLAPDQHAHTAHAHFTGAP
jgi:hypothetical protein